MLSEIGTREEVFAGGECDLPPSPLAHQRLR
jgi:hypothetical protein